MLRFAPCRQVSHPTETVLHWTESAQTSSSWRLGALVSTVLNLAATIALVVLAVGSRGTDDLRWRLIGTLAFIQALPCGIAVLVGIGEVLEPTPRGEAP